MGSQSYGIDPIVATQIAKDVGEIQSMGVETAIVIGGGNIFRGVAGGSVGMDRATADYMGMLATVMNSLALADTMRQEGMTARVMSAINIEQVVEPYVRPKALQYLEEGKVVIFAAGTGNPFFTTDTTAVLRAAELDCQAVLKATNVDGVYSADPKTDKSATRYDRLTPGEAMARNLKVMDTTAFALARENGMPIIVFSIREPGAIGEVRRIPHDRCQIEGDLHANFEEVRRIGKIRLRHASDDRAR